MLIVVKFMSRLLYITFFLSLTSRSTATGDIHPMEPYSHHHRYHPYVPNGNNLIKLNSGPVNRPYSQHSKSDSQVAYLPILSLTVVISLFLIVNCYKKESSPYIPDLSDQTSRLSPLLTRACNISGSSKHYSFLLNKAKPSKDLPLPLPTPASLPSSTSTSIQHNQQPVPITSQPLIPSSSSISSTCNSTMRTTIQRDALLANGKSSDPFGSLNSPEKYYNVNCYSCHQHHPHQLNPLHQQSESQLEHQQHLIQSEELFLSDSGYHSESSSSVPYLTNNPLNPFLTTPWSSTVPQPPKTTFPSSASSFVQIQSQNDFRYHHPSSQPHQPLSSASDYQINRNQHCSISQPKYNNQQSHNYYFDNENRTFSETNLSTARTRLIVPSSSGISFRSFEMYSKNELISNHKDRPINSCDPAKCLIRNPIPDVGYNGINCSSNPRHSSGPSSFSPSALSSSPASLSAFCSAHTCQHHQHQHPPLITNNQSSESTSSPVITTLSASPSTFSLESPSISSTKSILSTTIRTATPTIPTSPSQSHSTALNDILSTKQSDQLGPRVTYFDSIVVYRSDSGDNISDLTDSYLS